MSYNNRNTCSTCIKPGSQYDADSSVACDNVALPVSSGSQYAEYIRSLERCKHVVVEMSDTDSCTEEILTYIVIRNRRKKTRRARRFWVRPILTKRRQQGEYHQLLQEMRLSDPESHFRYLRMSKERFDTLLAKVGSNACQIWFNLYINYYNYFLWGLYNIRI